MKKLFFITAFAVMGLFPSNGQAQQTTIRETREGTDFLIGKFWDNWFISAGGGVNLYIGDYNKDLGKHLTPSFDLSVGKWITPAFGVRLQYIGFSMAATGDPSYWYTSDKSGLSDVKFCYHAIHTDFLVNLTTVISGYDPERFYQLIPYFGWGLSQSQSKEFNERKRNEFFAIAGLKNNFRLSNALDLHLDLKATFVSQRLAGHMIGGEANFPLAATVGLTYHFGRKNARRFRTCSPSISHSELIQNQINNLNDANAQLQAQNNNLKNELASIAERPVGMGEGKTVTLEKEIPLPVLIFFNINKYNLTKEDIIRLRYIAEYMKEKPNSKFTIKGYADSQTGNTKINKTLSDKRAQAVYDALVKIYGVNGSQLRFSGEGGIDKMFEPTELNRVSIIEAEH